MDKRTPLRRVIDRILKHEEDTYGPQELQGEGVLLMWQGQVYDMSEYGSQDAERKRRPGLDDDLDGWELLS